MLEASPTAETLLWAFKTLRKYHDHKVVGLEHVPTSGPAILAFNHSLATYDAFLLATVIYEELGRMPQALVHRMFFNAPGLGPALQSTGAFVSASRETAAAHLREGGMVAVAPGGVREAVMYRRKKYEVDWQNRRGFVWLSLVSGAPIILAAAPSADDIYRVYSNPLTRFSYKQLKMPFPIARGLGLTAFPKPTKVTHWLSEPIFPPVAPEDVQTKDVEHHHRVVTEAMNKLMSSALGSSQ